jgi:uncharacterized membrane protein YbhN (UPF0104 family)
VDSFLHAVELFVDRFAAVDWRWVVLGLACQLAKVACRTRAWRNIIAGAYPECVVRWRDIFGAYVAGVGVNAILPVRGGDVIKLYLARRSVPGSTYTTLGSTLVVEAIFDVAAGLALAVWAVRRGVLPGIDVVPRLSAFDLAWVIRHPAAAAAIGVALVTGALLVGIWAARHVATFKRRVAQGFEVLHDPGRYLRSVASWQAADWLFRILTLYCFLLAFGIGTPLGIEERLDNALLVQVTQSLSTLVPLTPGGIGTEQALVVYVLGPSAPVAALISFSIGMNLILAVFNAAVGFAAILVMLGTFRWRRHIEQEQARSREAPVEPRG